LRVLDGAVALFDAVSGVEPQTETVWRQADKYGVPRIAFINKLDRIGADFFGSVAMIADRLGAVPLVTQLPIGEGEDFVGVIDLVRQRAIVWKDETLGAVFEDHPIPEAFAAQAEDYRSRLISVAADVDDAVAEAYLEGREPDEATLRACIRKGTLDRRFVPVLCGAAFKNKGVQPLLDAVVDYLPSPADIVAVTGVSADGEQEIARLASDSEPFAALAFKVMTDPFAGTLTFVRIYSGVVRSGDHLVNAGRGKEERIGRMVLMHANSREEIEIAHAGDIVAFSGLKDTTTGDTLSAPSAPLVLERMDIPEPVIEIVVEPRTAADQEKLGPALAKLAAEDPSFRVSIDGETGQTVISGMGELHLEIIVDRLRREFRVDAAVGAPQVAYRETISSASEVDYLHEKLFGTHGQFARVKLRLEPAFRGEGSIVRNALPIGAVPKEFLAAIEKGIEIGSETGVLAGFPVIDLIVTLLDGAAHDVDSDDLAFEVATRAALREALAQASPKLLEPIMRVEVVTPDDYLGDVIGDLNSRRGQIVGMDQRSNARVLLAKVPLSRMFGYVNSLRSMSQGRAQFTMAFDHYADVPQAIAEEIRHRLAG